MIRRVLFGAVIRVAEKVESLVYGPEDACESCAQRLGVAGVGPLPHVDDRTDARVVASFSGESEARCISHISVEYVDGEPDHEGMMEELYTAGREMVEMYARHHGLPVQERD